jgi:hypothetical protein
MRKVRKAVEYGPSADGLLKYINDIQANVRAHEGCVKVLEQVKGIRRRQTTKQGAFDAANEHI